MSITISDEARQVLRAAGWREGALTDVGPIVAFLDERGFSVPPVAAEFIAEFHGFKARLTGRGGLSFISFDVSEEMAWIERDDRPFIDALASTPLCPVGHGGGRLLFVSSAGEMVILSDEWLGFSRTPTIAEGMDIVLGVRRTANYDGVPLTKEQIPPGFR